MKQTHIVSSLVFAALLELGCGAPIPPPQSTSAGAIVGGRADTKHTAVGMVGVTKGRSKTADFGCTGTLVASRTVLTAAHCVRTDANRRIAASRLRFALEGDVFDAQRVLTAPGYAPGSSGAWDDIAIILLGRAPDVEPMAYAQDAPAPDKTAEVIGFGVQVATGPHVGTGYGMRRRVSIEFDAVADRELSYDSSEKGACYGDSGGPIVQDLGAGEVVVGVTSRGTRVLCDGTDIATRVDAFRDWIAGAAE